MNGMVNPLFELERQYKSHLASGQASGNNDPITERISREINEIINEDLMRSGAQSLSYSPDLYYKLYIPVDILKESSKNALISNSTLVDVDSIHAFFLDEFEINTKYVDIIELDFMMDHAEAFAKACAIDEHFIALQTSGDNSFVSPDLLVHEIGHTVEYLKCRTAAQPLIGYRFPTISEAIAHYYQLIYMLKHSSEIERLGMIASTTASYFVYRCWLAMSDIDPTMECFDFSLIQHHELFDDFKNAYGDTDLLTKLINHYDGLPMNELFNNLHGMRFGFHIALNLIKHNLDVNELFKTKSNCAVISIENLIAQTNLDPNLVFDFSNVPETLYSFIDGTLLEKFKPE